MGLTLLDYARTQFPAHELDSWPERGAGALELTGSTLVAHVVGADATTEAFHALHQGGVGVPVAAVIVRPVEPTVIPRTDEDGGGIFDLPNRRALMAAVAGGAAGLVLGAIAALWLGLGWLGVLIIAVFTVNAGAAVGFITGSGARHAGPRAAEQPQAPGADIGVVAAFAPDEPTATGLAQLLYSQDQYDVRIVGPDGRWHSPND